ncbi:helix-turn-helix domain-containing protein [Paraburkholderia xenovorans]
MHQPAVARAINRDRKQPLEQPTYPKLCHAPAYPSHVSAEVVAETRTNRTEKIISTFTHEYWTTDETADYFRCQSQSIRKAISQTGTFHGLKPRRFGRRWYFSAAEVRATLEAA